MRFQINHLPNNEESTELELITCSPLRKGQTVGGQVIQMALFLELRQIWSSISSKPLFFLLSSLFKKKNKLIGSGADLNSSLSPA